MDWRALLPALALCFLSASSFAQTIPADRFYAQVGELLAELPPASDDDDARIGAQLFEIIGLLEPLVYEEREPVASRTYAHAAFALSGLSEFSRNGLPKTEWWRNARFAAESIDPAEAARIALDMARAMQADGLVADAHEIMIGALGNFDPVVRPWALTLLADMDRARGNAMDALERLDEAEEALIAGDAFHYQVRAVLYGLRGLVHLELGINDRAAFWFAEERALAEASGDPGLLLSVLIHSAALTIANPELEGASEELELALQNQLLQAGNPIVEASLRSMLARLKAYRAVAGGGEPIDIVPTLRSALEDSALPPEEAIDARLYLARMLLAHGDTASAELELTKVRESLSAMNAGRGTTGRARDRGLLAAIQCELELANAPDTTSLSDDTFNELNEAFDEMLAQWERTPIRPGGVGFLSSQERLTVIDVLIRAHIARDLGEAGVRRALETLIRAQARGTLARELVAQPCTVAEIRSRLLRDASLYLIYLPTPQRTHLFALSATELEHFELDGVHTFDSARRKFQALIRIAPADGQQRDSELARLGRELTDALLPDPIQARLKSKPELTIVGAEELGHLAFEALPLHDSRIGLALPISYLPSLPIGMSLLERMSAPSETWARDLLLVAAPTLDARVQTRWPRLRRLDLTQDELATLRGELTPSRVEMLHGDHATRAAVLAAIDAQSTRMLHILAHGVRDVERERPAGLALAGTVEEWGVLWPEHIETATMPPIVLLSACGAARGPTRFGDDGTSHLGGAFLRAGSNCVLLSRADVELRAMRVLSAELTQALAQGATPQQALLLARVEVAKSAGDDPFYFANLRAIGLADRPVFPEQASSPVSRKEPSARDAKSAMRLIFGLAGVVAALVIAAVVAGQRRTRRRDSINGS